MAGDPIAGTDRGGTLNRFQGLDLTHKDPNISVATGDTLSLSAA